MANYTLKFSDSVSTIDFYSGETKPVTPGYFVRENGLDLPPPTVNAAFNQSNQADGAPMSRSYYGNRTITITFGILGSTLADLKAKIRAIQDALNDAQYRYLLGAGNLYYLETQWGTSAGQSTYFDVIRGDLQLPTDWYASTKLITSFVILDCKLVLTCLPYGRFTTQTINNLSLTNSQGNLAVGENYISAFYNEGGTAQLVASNSIQATTKRLSQTFTQGSNQTIAGAAFYVYQINSGGLNLGNVYMEIYAVDANHKPTGAALATGNIASTNIPTATNALNNWTFCAFSVPVALTSGTEYALVIRCPSWVVGVLGVLQSVATNPYAGGQAWYSTDNGSTWTTIGNYDFAFAVLAQTTRVNYQEIATDSTYGDVPAGTLLNLSSLPTSKNIWVAKRTGNATISPAAVARYQEPLWIEAENYTACTIDNTSGAVNMGMIPISGGSAVTSYLSSGCSLYLQTSNVARNIAHYKYALSSISGGQFRVLARCRVTDITLQGFALGWENSATGSPSSVPLTSTVVVPAVNATWQVLDLGQFLLPSIANPGSSLLARMPEYLNIYCQSIAQTGSNYLYWDIDWIFLMPIDEGYINFKSNTGYVSIDSISQNNGVYDVDAALAYISNFFASVGTLPQVGRENTRFYVIMDAVESQTATLGTKYQPRFLTI